MCNVNIVTGEVNHFSMDFVLPGIIPLPFIRRYSSKAQASPSLGHGWTHSLEARIRLSEDRAQLTFDNSRIVNFEIPPIGGSARDDVSGLTLSHEPGSLVVTEPDLRRLGFARPARSGRDWLLTRKEDPFGNTIQFHYTNEGTLAQVIDSAGRALHIGTDLAGRIVDIRLGSARKDSSTCTLVRYEYDAKGDLSSAVDTTGAPYRYQYHDHLLVRVTNRIGGNLYYEYDARRDCVRTWRDGGVQFRDLRRDRARHVVGIRESRGYLTLYRNNEQGLTEEWVDPLGRARRDAHDHDGRLLVNNSESGAVHEVMHLDPTKRVLTRCAPGGQTVYRLDEHDRPLTVTNAEGHTTSFEYDHGGNVTRTVSPLGAEWRYRYDERGFLVGATDPRGYEIRKSRTAEGMVTVQDDWGVIYRTTCDLLGNPVTLEDGDGNRTQFEYDAEGRPIKLIYPDGTFASYAYDAEGNLVGTTDETGLTTRYLYDSNGTLLVQTEPDGRALKNEYDTEENLTAVVNFRGDRSESLYDAVGREVRIVYFDGHVEIYEYDDNDNVTALRDERGRPLAEYGYDDATRLAHVQWGDGTETKIAYGAQGEILSIAGPHTTIEYEWDPDLRIIKERVGDSSLEFEYDQCENRIALRTNTGRQITYEWDLRGRLIRLTDGGRFVYEYAHNLANVVTEVRLPHGLVQKFEYDAMNRLVRRRVVRAVQGLPVADRTLHYDGAHRLSRMEDMQRGAFSYRYDDSEHVTEVIGPTEAEFYQYDANENLLRTRGGASVVIASGDRVLSAGPETYDYDDNGNLVGKRTGREVTRYRYDAQGQLVHVTHPSGAQTEYQYDPLGRRIRKVHAGVETKYDWDGVALLGEAGPGEAVEYLFLPGSFLPVGLTQNGAHFSYGFDQLGTPTELFNGRGEVAWSANFSAFGEERVAPATAVRNPFRFQGQYFDEELGLCYNRHRYYNPSLNRFLTPDPIGLQGGINLYRYVPNPVNWVDPFGLVPCGVLFKCSWSKKQREDAQKKVDAMNDQLGNGKKIPDKVPDECEARKNAKKIYEECQKKNRNLPDLKLTSSKCSNQQADHIREVCLGGAEKDCNNLQPLNQSVNASFGSQMAKCAKDNAGKMLTGIKVKPGCKPGGKKCPDV